MMRGSFGRLRGFILKSQLERILLEQVKDIVCKHRCFLECIRSWSRKVCCQHAQSTKMAKNIMTIVLRITNLMLDEPTLFITIRITTLIFTRNVGYVVDYFNIYAKFN